MPASAGPRGGMFGINDSNQNNQNNQNQVAGHNYMDGQQPLPPSPFMEPPSGGNPAPPPPPPPAPAPTDYGAIPSQAPSPTGDPQAPAAPPPPPPANADALISLKEQALGSLSPLVNHLEQTPEEKFKTMMMLIQASDNSALVKDAYEAANRIPDEKARAQALLDVVNEINYFTQKKN